MSNLLDDLKSLQAYMDTHPIIQAVWFIDRPQSYRTMQSMLLTCGYTVNNLRLKEGKLEYLLTNSLQGIQLHDWPLKELDAKIAGLVNEGWTPERIARLYPFREPGVWVQMSNDKHYELVMESTGWVMIRL